MRRRFWSDRTEVRHVRSLLAGLALLCSIPAPCWALDKSGVTPNAISLPSGPGSIEGLGESFQTMLNTGTAKQQVAITVPPGTAGHAPALTLDYEGGGSNGPLGFGWQLRLPFVQRQADKGIPRYIDGPNSVDDDGDGQVDEPDELDVFLNEEKEELVLGDDGYYRCEIEGAFIRYRRIGERWEATLPDGTRLEFGSTPEARVSDGTRVYRWLIDRSIDTHGNSIVYHYRGFPDATDANQLYLWKVEYGPGPPPWDAFHFVIFEYEGRADAFEDGRAGFLVRTGKRLREIVVGTQGTTLPDHAAGDLNSDGVGDFLDQKYLLSYEAHPHWSLLTRVTQVGADGASTLPPMILAYKVADPPDVVSASGSVVGAVDAPFQVMDNDLVDLVDLNGDSLPDILKTESFGGLHTAYLNEGERDEAGGRAIQWGPPTPVGGDPLAGNVNLAATSGAVAHLADMDANGISDLVYKTADTVYYFPNGGDVTWAPRLTMNADPGESSPPAPFGTENVRTADLDFDKRMDIVQSVSVGAGAQYRIWFNLGNQRYSRSVTVAQAWGGVMFSAPGVQVADFNGDRVPDIVRITPSGLDVALGLGYGRFTSTGVVVLPDHTLDTSQLSKARLQDVTGDGLVDLVIERAAPGELWYWINLGNRALDRRRMLSGLPTALGVSPETRWADLNANGSTDLIYADSSREPRIQVVDIGRLIGCVPRPNLLTTIESGVGGKTTIEYTTSTTFLLADAAAGSPWPDPLPFPINVVERVTDEDGLGNRYVTEYRYHDGYYDGEEREFRGFGAAEQQEIGDPTAPDLVTAYRFHTGADEKALKGKPLWIELRDAQNGVFYREDRAWTVRTLLTDANGDGRSTRFAFQHERLREVIEQGRGTPVQLRWQYDFDDYGNEIRQVEHGRLDPGWNDERVTETSYTAQYPDGLSTWILRGPVETRTKDGSGAVAAHSRHYYDSNSVLGILTRGNLTRTEQWVGGSEYIVSERNTFDNYGNVIADRDPLFGAQPGHWREVAYDPVFHTYAVREDIHTGNPGLPILSSSAEYDAGLGVVTSSTDFNGHTTTYVHDPFARLSTITRPFEDGPTVEYDYVLLFDAGGDKALNWVETRKKDGSPGDGFLRSRVFYDGLGRQLMVRTEDGESGYVNVTQVVEFNAKKAPRTEFLPYREAGTLDYAPPNMGGGFTERFYDAMGREIRTHEPIVSGRIEYTETEYRPLSRIVRDENQTDSESSHFGSETLFVDDGLADDDGDSRLREIHEIVKISDTGESATQPAQWITRYAYDVLNNLTKLVDSQGNETEIHYDRLSRVTTRFDPDRGTTSYNYDAASNLVESTDGKGQTIVYSYDGLNRLVAEDYLDEGLPFSANRSPDVELFYDAPAGAIDCGDGTLATASDTKGLLSWVSDLSGEEHRSYDARGRLTWVVKSVRDAESGVPMPFKTETTYDSMDRVRDLIYPDKDRIHYTYNDRGLLEQIHGGPGVTLLSRVDYDAAGQVERYDFGNGVTTWRGYDERLRLSDVQSYRNHNPGDPLMFYRYERDGASNTVQIDDLRTEISVPQGEPRRNSQRFEYDDLYRLTSVDYDFSTPSQPGVAGGRIDYRYDRIGNMLSKTSDIGHDRGEYSLTNIGQMFYGGAAGRFGRSGREPGDPPGPGALTQTDNGSDQRVIEYDDNGNMVTLEGRTFEWDFKDRLVSAEGDGLRLEFVYDYEDRRIVKKVRRSPVSHPVAPAPIGETIYVDENFELRDGQPVKYVRASGQRIARVAGTLDPSARRVQRLLLREGWNLLALAVDPSSGLPPGIDRVIRWSHSQDRWIELLPATPLGQGDVVWLHAVEALLLVLEGVYNEPTEGPVSGGSYHGWGLEEIRLPSPQAGSSLWVFDPAEQRWVARIGGEASAFSEAPDSLPAGQPLYVQGARASVDLATSILYYHRDHLGSADVTTDRTGKVHSEQHYYPFGGSRSLHTDGAPQVHYTFTGQEFDAETGLYNYQARLLDPAIAQFLTPDGIIPDWYDLQQLNPYRYTRNSPLNFTDPTGNETTGEFIERMGVEAAGEGRNVSAFGWAFAQAAWDVLGAENISKVTDNVITNRKDLTKADIAWAVVEGAGAVGGLGGGVAKLAKAAKGAKAAKTATQSAKAAKEAAKAAKAAAKLKKQIGKRANKLRKQGKLPGLFNPQGRAVAEASKNLPDLLRPFNRFYKQSITQTTEAANNAIAMQNKAIGLANHLWQERGIRFVGGITDAADMADIIPKATSGGRNISMVVKYTMQQLDNVLPGVY